MIQYNKRKAEASMAKILVVEDERELNDILKASLNSEGYEVVAAFNGKLT